MNCSNFFDFGQANEHQKEAILAVEGPELIIAGPGTGKTFTLVKRIAYLIIEKKVKPSEIMVVTFTEKAGKELLTRISNEFIQYNLNLNINDMYIGTFHSVCLRLLKENSQYVSSGMKSRMLDAFEQTYLVCRNLDAFKAIKGFNQYIHVKNDWKQSLEICRYVNQLMEELVDIDAMLRDADEDMRFLAKMVKIYQNMLDANNAMDFSSIQTKTYEMFIENPVVLEKVQETIKYIMVDEYQDTNYIQEQLIFLLAGKRKNICVVGDDDQGMYRFRGATIRNILEFPDKFIKGECKIVHLNMNYRSEPQIIDFYNQWMENVDGINLFNWDKFRYPKKIVSGKNTILNEQAVFSCGGDSLDEEKEALFNLIQKLKQDGNITDYNQIAFLFRSVKSEEAVTIGAYLESQGIPVYSPRSDLFFDRIEVKQIFGSLILCFLSYVQDLKKNLFTHRISEELRNYYIECIKSAAVLIKQNTEFSLFVEKKSKEIRLLKGEGEEGLLDLFYQLIAYEPFNTYLQADLRDNVNVTRAARNLSEVSRMLSKYMYLHDMHTINDSNKLAMSEEFFNIYLKYMYADGIGEYEDESEYAPHGCVSFMTIHQSKGLEFPVVIVGSLGNVPRRNSDALMFGAESRFFHRKPYEPLADIKFFDFWRLYYTAFSRAQNLLVLAAKKRNNKYFKEYWNGLSDVETLNSNESFEKVKAVNYKHIYSFTSHVSVYDHCPKQYKYYKEYGFAQNQMFQTSVGSLVHATLEDMNKCIINGERGRVNEASIEAWFELNYKQMQKETGYFLSEEQKDNAMKQIIRYYHHRQDELGKVWKAEDEINLVLPKYILQGVIDLIEGEGDTVEIVDYKTGPKPEGYTYLDKVEHYRKQLEVYAYLVEKRYGKKVSKMHLYYTSVLEGNPLISFEWKRDSIDKTIEQLANTIERIENCDFDGDVTNSYSCRFCDMRYLCAKSMN